MKHRKLKIGLGLTGIILVAFPGMTAAVIGVGTKLQPIQNYNGSFGDWLNVNTSKWMQHINDSTFLSMMTIPGTHDSLTAHLSIAHGWANFAAFSAMTSKYTLEQQLEAGVRLFDFRMFLDKNQLICIHGAVKCLDDDGTIYHLDTAFKIISNFLKTNPSETVITYCKHGEAEGGG